PSLVRAALKPTVELPSGHLGYRIVDTGRIGPTLADLNVSRPQELAPALRAWRDAALSYWGAAHWLTVESIAPRLVRLDAVLEALLVHRRRLEVEPVWKLVNAPIDEDEGALLGVLAVAL